MKTQNIELAIGDNWVEVTDIIEVAKSYLISSNGSGCVLQYYIDDTTPPTETSIGHTVTNEAVGGTTTNVQLRAVTGDKVYFRAIDVSNMSLFRGETFRLKVALTSLS